MPPVSVNVILAPKYGEIAINFFETPRRSPIVSCGEIEAHCENGSGIPPEVPLCSPVELQ